MGSCNSHQHHDAPLTPDGSTRSSSSTATVPQQTTDNVAGSREIDLRDWNVGFNNDADDPSARRNEPPSSLRANTPFSFAIHTQSALQGGPLDQADQSDAQRGSSAARRPGSFSQDRGGGGQWRRRHPLLLWYTNVGTEDLFAVHFCHPRRNMVITYCLVIAVVVLYGTLFWKASTIPTLFVVRLGCALVWFSAFAGSVILKCLQKPLLYVTVAPVDIDLEGRLAANNDLLSRLVEPSAPVVNNDATRFSFADPVTNALAHEVICTFVIIANYVDAITYNVGRWDCGYIAPQRRDLDCTFALNTESSFIFFLMIGVYFAPIRFPRFLLWTVLSTAAFFGSPFLSSSIATSASYLDTEFVVVGVSVVVAIVSRWLNERWQRRDFDLVIERQLRSLESEVVRRQCEALAAAEVPLSAVRSGAFERPECGSWAMGQEVIVCCVAISGFTAWSSRRGPCDTTELLQSMFVVFDGIRESRGLDKRRRLSNDGDDHLPQGKAGLVKFHSVGDCYIVAPDTDGSPHSRMEAADQAAEVMRFALGCSVLGTIILRRSLSDQTWFNFNASLTPKNTSEHIRGASRMSRDERMRLVVAVACGAAQGVVIRRTRSVCIAGRAVATALSQVREVLTQQTLQLPSFKSSPESAVSDAVKLYRNFAQSTLSLECLKGEGGSGFASPFLTLSNDQKKSLQRASLNTEASLLMVSQAILDHFHKTDAFPLNPTSIRDAASEKNHMALLVPGAEFVMDVSHFENVGSLDFFLKDFHLLWVRVYHDDDGSYVAEATADGESNNIAKVESEDKSNRNRLGDHANRPDSIVEDRASNPLIGNPTVAVVAGQRRVAPLTPPSSMPFAMRRRWWNLFSSFADESIEDKYQRKCTRLDNTDEVMWAGSAIILSFAALVIVMTTAIELRARQDGVAMDPALWLSLGLGSAAIFVLLSWVSGRCPTVAGREWPQVMMHSCQVVLMVGSVVMYCIAIFVIPRGNTIGNSHAVWFLVVANILLCCPAWADVSILCAQDFAFAFAFGVRLARNVDMDADMQQTMFVLIGVAWLCCLSCRVLMDHSKREAFAAELAIVELKQMLEADQLRLEEALRVMTPDGIAAALTERSRSQRRKALAVQRPFANADYTDQSGDREDAALATEQKILVVCYLRLCHSTAVSTVTKDVPFLVLRLGLSKKRSDGPDDINLLTEGIQTLVFPSLEPFVSSGRLEVVKCSGDTVVVGVPPMSSLDDRRENKSDANLRSAAAVLCCALKMLETSRHGRAEMMCKMVLDYAPLMGGILGSHGMTFEYYGGGMSVALDAVEHIVDWGSALATDRLLFAAKCGFEMDNVVLPPYLCSHDGGVVLRRGSLLLRGRFL